MDTKTAIKMALSTADMICTSYLGDLTDEEKAALYALSQTENEDIDTFEKAAREYREIEAN